MFLAAFFGAVIGAIVAPIAIPLINTAFYMLKGNKRKHRTPEPVVINV